MYQEISPCQICLFDNGKHPTFWPCQGIVTMKSSLDQSVPWFLDQDFASQMGWIMCASMRIFKHSTPSFFGCVGFYFCSQKRGSHMFVQVCLKRCLVLVWCLVAVEHREFEWILWGSTQSAPQSPDTFARMLHAVILRYVSLNFCGFDRKIWAD
jgi:hypothetical protein